MVIRSLVFSLFIMSFINVFSQSENDGTPKLVVGIVVDQMRFDYLYKYQEKYSNDGFKKLIREGYNFKNTHFNYIPTVTAAGHASIYTGTTPSVHGVIGNSWYDRKSGSNIGNVVDDSERLVGSAKESESGISPRNLLANSISDQLRLGSNFQSKVISVSLKDRGAVLPGGHSASAAYWHDYISSPGYFVSSTYYMEKVPDWVANFNKEGLASTYLDTIWNTLLPIETYTESAADKNNYENILGGKPSATFPYNLRQMRARFRAKGTEYQLLWVTPMGNDLLTEFAKKAIEAEKLGQGSNTDMLCISYSTPDVAGHTFGPQSVEIEDIYLRLDQNIAELIKYLDSSVGEDEYVIFLTADHAAIHVASYLNDNKLPSGLAQINDYYDSLSAFLNKKYGSKEWIEYFGADQVYLDHDVIKSKKIDLAEIQQSAADHLAGLEGVHTVMTAHQLKNYDYSKGIKDKIQNGFLLNRSGDILLAYDPGYIANMIEGKTIDQIKGTTHGSGWAYDTHVPLLWYGAGIKKGQSSRQVSITDIAPSLSMMLNLQLPNGVSGQPLTEIIDE